MAQLNFINESDLMEYNEELTARITQLLNTEQITFEIKRFGGFNYFMKGGKVIATAMNTGILVKCNPELLSGFLKQTDIQPVPDPAGEPQKDMFVVAYKAIENDEELKSYLQIGIDYATK
jgi:hypothetical protein